MHVVSSQPLHNYECAAGGNPSLVLSDLRRVSIWHSTNWWVTFSTSKGGKLKDRQSIASIFSPGCSETSRIAAL
jgi:hypothetical protein